MDQEKNINPPIMNDVIDNAEDDELWAKTIKEFYPYMMIYYYALKSTRLPPD